MNVRVGVLGRWGGVRGDEDGGELGGFAGIAVFLYT